MKLTQISHCLLNDQCVLRYFDFPKLYSSKVFVFIVQARYWLPLYWYNVLYETNIQSEYYLRSMSFEPSSNSLKYFYICFSIYIFNIKLPIHKFLILPKFHYIFLHIILSLFFVTLYPNIFHSLHTSIYFCLNKAFRHVETLFIQGVCYNCTGSLLFGAIPPTNSEPVQ